MLVVQKWVQGVVQPTLYYQFCLILFLSQTYYYFFYDITIHSKNFFTTDPVKIGCS